MQVFGMIPFAKLRFLLANWSPKPLFFVKVFLLSPWSSFNATDGTTRPDGQPVPEGALFLDPGHWSKQ